MKDKRKPKYYIPKFIKPKNPALSAKKSHKAGKGLVPNSYKEQVEALLEQINNKFKQDKANFENEEDNPDNPFRM